ncbi:PEP-CTERM sorting domain-containing protein [Luteolibacter sp. SL250]|uniref:PEP-CTERM sorting domain-containing protein n=1 Tax=Luteolibacter sp. SL250 TaxID=2995170 RepID=UPI0022720CC2|nr:PEP-CTERM sorting domain-containing protein [Luteolibacter sp. SL250]WAC19866.1 PEP-CTERM sorting domain-containing protein [Luteolibacter sp. SL250]
MTLYINPDFSLGDANLPALEVGDENSGFFVTGNSGWTLGTFKMTSNLSDAGQSVIFDEFKIGTEWADMADVIPEPSTSLLAMLPLLGVLRRRR